MTEQLAKPIPPRWSNLYWELEQYFGVCRADEVETDWPTVSCFRAIQDVARLESRVRELGEQALRAVDRLAEAGLCQFTAGGKHAFLKDIRLECSGRGIQGGLVLHVTDKAAQDG